MLAMLNLCFRVQANTYSWAAVQPLLAERLNAVVVSHDMPGFGLTQRSATSTMSPNEGLTEVAPLPATTAVSCIGNRHSDCMCAT